MFRHSIALPARRPPPLFTRAIATSRQAARREQRYGSGSGSGSGADEANPASSPTGLTAAASAEFYRRGASRFGARPPASEESKDAFVQLAEVIEQAPVTPARDASLPAPKRPKYFIPNSFYPPYALTVANRTYTPESRRPRLSRLGPPAPEARARDPFYQLSIDPLDEVHNASLLSYYVTELGRIRPRSQTGLTWRSQRRMGKAVRRAKMMGIIPIMSRVTDNEFNSSRHDLNRPGLAR